MITFPVGALYSPRALRAFVCTNPNLSDEEILSFYVQRWKIEVFFRDVKTKLAFDQYQIRSANGIQRFWRITSLAFLMACSVSISFDFSEGYLILSHAVVKEQLAFIFHSDKNGISLDSLLELVA
ncbi:MAG: transposase [Bacteroides sp.]|nr:transposase [Bacteroides sp.]